MIGSFGDTIVLRSVRRGEILYDSLVFAEGGEDRVGEFGSIVQYDSLEGGIELSLGFVDEFFQSGKGIGFVF